MSDRERDFGEFYLAVFPRLVGQLTAQCGSVAEAEDVVQEALSRAYRGWRRVCEYDVPEAWVRVVALRIAISKERRRKVARAALPLLASRHHLPSVADAVDARETLIRALQALTPEQRRAVVLHHIADQSVEDIAASLQVSPNTVKSWLSRGRRRLQEELGEPTVDTEPVLQEALA